MLPPSSSASNTGWSRSAQLETVRAWYNGYVFGGEVVYNPWSVLCFLDRDEERPQPYWLSTSSNDLVRELVVRYALRLQPVFEALLEGGSIERMLDDNVALSEIRDDEGALWTLGFDYNEREWRTGKYEYDVVRNGRKTGEFARVIEFRKGKVRIWGADAQGQWRVWNGRTFV
jgi:hypothetical protein